MRSLIFALFVAACLPGCASYPMPKEAPIAYQPVALPSGCQTPAPTVKSLNIGNIYSDAKSSVFDEAGHTRYLEASAPVRNWRIKVGQLADAYVASGKREDAQCAIQWLDAWARDGGLLGSMESSDRGTQGYFEQKWALGSAAIAYMKVQTQATPDQDQRIRFWLLNVSHEVRAFWDYKYAGKVRHNNHIYYTGAGLLAVGIVTKDKSSIDQARKYFDEALEAIQDDGTMPWEIGRGQRALHYTHFAMLPIMVMAELAPRIGEDWYARGGDKIRRAAQRTIASELDRGYIAEKAQSHQEGVLVEDLCWLHIYAAHNEDPRIAEILKGRIVKSTYYGDLRNLVQ